ncbi:molybdate ABC transporter substrate-binding protein [Rhodobacteraceae bacterium 63075]|nr:molybdate ABC transporter substrate-binding protein [Rhodobacteraceae bacterium 63075]
MTSWRSSCAALWQTLRRALLAAACLWLGSAASLSAERVTVFAAASLKTALDALEAPFEAQSGDELVLVYAGSSALARQISQGAPADVFLSANVAWMDAVEAQGRLHAGTRRDLLENTLVLIAPAPAQAAPLETLAEGAGYIAMGLVEAVPAGIYAREALEHLGLWEQVAARVAQTDNVRAALALVARGEAQFGLVYRTDALAEPRVDIVSPVPPEAHEPIIYPAARIAGSGDGAGRFMDFLTGRAAAEIFEAQGFGLLAEPGK